MRSAILVFLGVAVCVSVAANAGQQGPPQFTVSSDELEGRNQRVTEEDLRILRRADQILSSQAVWNRHDTRICKPEDQTWSLFCAMEKASLDVLGQYQHRQVALQEVRFAVEDVTKGMNFEHRIMDYNNPSRHAIQRHQARSQNGN